MLPLGTTAPDFELPNTNAAPNMGATVHLTDFADCKALLVMFICNHCPYVKHVAKQLAAIGREYQNQGVGIVAISSNDADEYTDDTPEKMSEEAAAQGYTFPYLHDATQAIAQAYTAACTPDFFLFASSEADHKASHKLVYRGQLDETRPTRISSGNYNFDDSPAHGSDLRAALDAVLKGDQPTAEQKPSMGCNIKWKPGNEPAYSG